MPTFDHSVITLLLVLLNRLCEQPQQASDPVLENSLCLLSKPVNLVDDFSSDHRGSSAQYGEGNV